MNKHGGLEPKDRIWHVNHGVILNKIIHFSDRRAHTRTHTYNISIEEKGAEREAAVTIGSHLPAPLLRFHCMEMKRSSARSPMVDTQYDDDALGRDTKYIFLSPPMHV